MKKDMGLLYDKTAIVTGSGRGIGRAAAIMLAQQGARVMVSDLNVEPAEETVEVIRAAGGTADLFVGDVTKADFADNIMSAVEERFGGLDILVNNAGYAWDGMIHKVTDEQWAAMLDVHLTASFRMIRAAASLMRYRAISESAAGGLPKTRKIINVSSTSGTRGNIGQVSYATAKAGLIGLTKTVAREWGTFQITCNAVAFGFVDTRLTRAKEDGEVIQGGKVQLGIPGKVRDSLLQTIPLGRAASPEEAAGGILLLASPWADYISGQVIEVNGGSHT
jgi:3-oxoacyl-[acyl-carrier protein] reductase